jgi:hypothetical protein
LLLVRPVEDARPQNGARLHQQFCVSKHFATAAAFIPSVADPGSPGQVTHPRYWPFQPLVAEIGAAQGQGFNQPSTANCSAVGNRRVDDRIRTGDRLDHNQELYQLSYVHRVAPI